MSYCMVRMENIIRVLLLDEESEPLPIRRNHSYNIEIVGPLSYGYDSFAEALDGTPTNNVWISVPDDINEVSDGTHRLIVDETFVVYLGTTTRSVDLTYRYEVKNGDGGVWTRDNWSSACYLGWRRYDRGSF